MKRGVPGALKWWQARVRGLLIVAGCCAVGQAKPVPAGLFTHHAVLQQGRAVPVWGTAEANEKVTVSFAGQTTATTADASGKWTVLLKPLAASAEPRELIIRGGSDAPGDTVTLTDVLVGEVWLASGQSNMEMTVQSSADAKTEKEAATFPAIRQFYVPRQGSLKPLDTVKGNWVVCSPETVGGFSGVAYFYARDLYQKLGIPIGILHSSFGGTPAEAWTSLEALRTVPTLKTQAEDLIARMEKAPKLREEFPARLAAWEAANGVVDAENAGVKQGWASPDFDDSAWTKANVGFTLASALKAKNGGVFWLRKVVELPESSAGNPFQLGLGWLAEQYDTVYFNGVEVGSIGKKPPSFYTGARSYNIPGKLVQAGRNVIAVRFVSHTEKGAFYIAGRDMQLPVPDPKAVDNSWRITFEREFPALSAEALAARPALELLQIQSTSTGLYNAMIHPLIPYALRGVIWYQGESNTNPAPLAELYRTLFPLLIKDWRTRWQQGDFPFYFVQLANNGGVVRNHGASSWAVLREAQSETLAKTPNTGMAVIIDVGSDITIHPLNKQDVGKRLALWARAKTYGEKGLVYQSPLYKSAKVEGGKIRVRFDTGGARLMVGKKTGLDPVVPTPQAKLEWFEIAGADGKWAWADAVIDGDSVVVSSTEVAAPVKARYGWATNPEGCNLYNAAGLPASPFRTQE
ncbi:MAG: 9-O-acetylesterase [Verrucomicrobia bacterium]|nr:9-O-acetylesterase [Verrucomicrobiota bacterium]